MQQKYDINNQEVIFLLGLYLKKVGSYSSFFENLRKNVSVHAVSQGGLKKYFANKMNSEKLFTYPNNYNKDRLVIKAFVWDETKEGFAFWSLISQIWSDMARLLNVTDNNTPEVRREFMEEVFNKILDTQIKLENNNKKQPPKWIMSLINT